jgi:hypothetical protein
MTKRVLRSTLSLGEQQHTKRRGCLSIKGPPNSSGVHRRLLGCHLRERDTKEADLPMMLSMKAFGKRFG